MNYNFIEAGSNVKNKHKNLYLDVGNNLTNGIIDHHQLIDIQKSATRLVYENKKFISNDIDTITLHKSPDLDCVASSYLANYYINNNCFPKFTDELCNFLDKVDFGYKTSNLISLSTIFSVIKSNCSNDETILIKGHKLIEDLSNSGFDSGIKQNKYLNEMEYINNDYKIFEKDMQQSKIYKYTLENKRIDGLALYKPKSILFKYWARDIGYDLLIVKWSKKRTVISLKADTILSLKGIGDRLNFLEEMKRRKKNIVINEEIREGYNIPDPWYDGRAHNYTIVDSPLNGTILKFDQIISTISFKYRIIL